MQYVLRSLQGNLKMLGQASAKLNFVVPFTGSSVVLRRPLITPVGGRSPYTPALARSAAKRSLSSARTSLMQANANSRERDNERTLVRGRRDWGWPFSIMRRDPFFMSPLMDLDRFWSDFDALAQRSNAYLPALDITETNDAFVVSCELAGVPRENVKIALDGDILTVQGEKKWEHEEKDAKMHRMERSYGSFSRSVRLPTDVVDAENIKAQHKDGVLRITIPKKVKQQENVKEIPIEVS
jgi:HSP20 family protein